MTQYAISEYPNVDEVYAKLETLTSQPTRPVRREKMTESLNYFDTKCIRSKQLTDEAKQIIPGGVQHNLAFNSPSPLKKRTAHISGVRTETSILDLLHKRCKLATEHTESFEKNS